MTIANTLFPLTMNKISGGHGFHTDITIGKSGHEVRNANWQDALWKGNAAYAVKNRADAIVLRNFHLARHGREIGFLLQLGDDYKIPDSGSTSQAIGTGDGSDTTFQIYKRYSDADGNYYDRTITRISALSSDLEVYKDSVLQTLTTHYTVNTSTGLITFVAAPANGIVISVVVKKFYIPVRFDVDRIDVDMFYWTVNGSVDTSLHSLPDIPLVEIKE